MSRFISTRFETRARTDRELAGRAKGRVPALENSILIDDAENVRSIEQNRQCAERRDGEEDEQLQTIDHRGDVLPVVANLDAQRNRIDVRALRGAVTSS